MSVLMNYFSYKLVVAYDGTDYCGWQQQKNRVSVDSLLRKTFLRSFRQKNILLVGASRTDAGVHARGQVVRLRTLLPLEPEKLKKVLNRALPCDVRVHSCERIDCFFHPQRNVLLKTYTYSFSLEKPSPMQGRFLYHFPHDFDVEKMAQALALFEGTHDFRYFCKEAFGKRSTVKTVKSIRLEVVSDEYKKYVVIIKGQSFLRYMIRRIVGASLAVASREDLMLDDLKAYLYGKGCKVRLLITAPAYGLCLESIEYETQGENA